MELMGLKLPLKDNDIAKTEVFGEENGDVLILSWGGTYGSCRSAVETLHDQEKSVSHVHVRWISPLPKDLGEIIIKLVTSGFKITIHNCCRAF